MLKSRSDQAMSSFTQSEFTLEESLVMSNLIYTQNIQRVFHKYDRHFSLDEEGGALVSMYETDLVFEEQVANLIQNDLAPNRSRSSPSTSEDEIEVEMTQKMAIIRNTDTTDIADLVVKAKREINWDEEERIYHMKKQKQLGRKQQAASSEDDSDLNISGSSRSVTNWAKKTKRSRKRRKLSMDAPRFCDSSAHLNSSCSLSNGVEGAIFNMSTVLESSYYDSGNDDISSVAPTSNHVGNLREQKPEIVLESSYYDSGNDDISSVAPTSSHVGNQRKQKPEIVLESSYYDSGNDDMSSVAPTSSHVGNQREQKPDIVLESSYYDSGNDDMSSVAPTSSHVGNQMEQNPEIVLESSYYDSS